MTKPILVLLPGLDGSGELFAPLVAKLAETVDTRIVRLPLDGEQTQRALAQRLLPLLPSEPFALLAESFSGAVALELARLKPAGLRQLILVATFFASATGTLLEICVAAGRYCMALASRVGVAMVAILRLCPRYRD